MRPEIDFKNVDYRPVYLYRVNLIRKINEGKISPSLLFAHYKNNPCDFIEDWVCTTDPRSKSPNMPFMLYDFQKEFVHWLHKKFLDQQSGLVEKSRDMGATWICCAFSVWVWAFHPNNSVGWCSQKQASVDKLGDMNSIFEKIRFIIRRLPKFMLPPDFRQDKHLLYARVLNTSIGSTIIGEFGPNAGRGGRCSIYFKDEAQPLDCDILYPDGFGKMRDVEVGDYIVGGDGKPTKVTQIKDFPLKKVYRVTFDDGESTKCSKNHLWTVRDYTVTGSEFKTISLKNIMASSEVFTSNWKHGFDEDDEYSYYRVPPTYTVPPIEIAHSRYPSDTVYRGLRVMVKIERVQNAPVRCISVEAEDGLYITDNFIVTHNSAHYQNSELLEASLSQTANCKIDISTPNGVDNEFYRKRHAGEIDVFIMDWRDDPRKGRVWYERQKAELPPMILAQEVDRDYLRSRSDLVFVTDWVREAIEIDDRYDIEPTGLTYAGLDVAYEGNDKSVLVVRKGFKVLSIHSWHAKTPTETARKAITLCIEHGVDILNYDAIGMGAGVDGEIKSIKENMQAEGRVLNIKAYGIHVGIAPDDKRVTRGLSLKDRFTNLKAQIFWALRDRFQKTYEYTQDIHGNLDEIICIPNHKELIKELYSITYESTNNGKICITKKSDMNKSPDFADGLGLAYYNPRKTIRVWSL